MIDNAAPAMVQIALNSHGTRALQKMIEFITTPEQIQTIINALNHRVVELIQDLNGNHVIQKCLNRLSSEDAQVCFCLVPTSASLNLHSSSSMLSAQIVSWLGLIVMAVASSSAASIILRESKKPSSYNTSRTTLFISSKTPLVTTFCNILWIFKNHTSLTLFATRSKARSPNSPSRNSALTSLKNAFAVPSRRSIA